MILTSSLIGGWEKMSLDINTNLAVFMFLFMVCAFEVVIMKLTTSNSSAIFGRPGVDPDLDDSSEYEEDIYYEELHNNYEQWSRRRMRYRQRQQQLQQMRQQQTQQHQQQEQQQQQLYA